MLLLDNCEHVVEEAAAFASKLLQQCEGVTILATTREPLGVAGEQVWAIPPLTPEESVELLTARAGSAGVGLDTAVESGASANRLLDRLDGLPLAIELAAARLRSMSLNDLVDRLDDRFALLSVGPRSAELRQQTLRNLVDWSHDLLDERERSLFRRLAAFSGGATLEAIETVCSDPIDATVANESASAMSTPSWPGSSTSRSSSPTTRQPGFAFACSKRWPTTRPSS